MTVDDLARWEPRRLGREGAPGAPEPFLVREVGQLPAGPVLEVAAGELNPPRVLIGRLIGWIIKPLAFARFSHAAPR